LRHFTGNDCLFLNRDIALIQPQFQGLALGGTGILIVVSVVVETMKQLEAQLLIRQYEGFIR